MTLNLGPLANVRSTMTHMTVNLPTSAKAVVYHVRDACLRNGFKLHNVLYLSNFTHNLLSIHKLSKDINNCYAMSFPTGCTIIDSQTHAVKSEGTITNKLYHLSHLAPVNEDAKPHLQCSIVTNPSLADQYTLWHNRLGHAHVSKLKYIDCIKHYAHVTEQVCLICPLAKFTKLPFPRRESYAYKVFEFIHIDIRGPYKMCTRKKFKYFLTIVDDFSRRTWIYLLLYKSEYIKSLELFH